MNVFISGGCKNGKSHFAQEIARDTAREKNANLFYIATMIPRDDEDILRIKRHIADREGWGFETIEIGTDIERLPELVNRALENSEKGGREEENVFLLDSVTALLSNEMFHVDEGGNFLYKRDAGEKVARGLLNLMQNDKYSFVFVSDFIYSDASIFDEYTLNYVRSLARIDRMLARECRQVIEVAFGIKRYHKYAKRKEENG